MGDYGCGIMDGACLHGIQPHHTCPTPACLWHHAGAQLCWGYRFSPMLVPLVTHLGSTPLATARLKERHFASTHTELGRCLALGHAWYDAQFLAHGSSEMARSCVRTLPGTILLDYTAFMWPRCRQLKRTEGKLDPDCMAGRGRLVELMWSSVNLALSLHHLLP